MSYSCPGKKSDLQQRNQSDERESWHFHDHQPEMATAAEIARLLRFPSAIKIDPFAKGKVELLKFRLKPEFRLDGKSIVEINMKGKHNILVAGVERGEQVFIPNGDFVLQNGDLVSILASPKNASAFFKSIGLKTNQVRNCMIVGGGTIAIFLARMLLEMKMRVVIIEQSKERCELLADLLPDATVVNGMVQARTCCLKKIWKTLKRLWH